MFKKIKAQLKIQEMSFMLVAVLLFFVLAGLFALSIFNLSISKDASAIEREKILFSVTNLADTPEFTCGESRHNCIDADKLIVLLNRNSYKNFWQFSSLKVVKITALSKPETKWVKCNLANYPDCDYFLVYDKKITNEKPPVSSFVSLCRQQVENNYPYNEPGKCEMAMLVAGVKQ
jgi:hypothetical protein